MSLPKANEKLRRGLKEAATLLKWSGVDLFVISKRKMAAAGHASSILITTLLALKDRVSNTRKCADYRHL
jgi:hypothetical protein